MIRSMISKTINSTITTIINPFDGLLSRYFITLDPVLNSHYEMAAPITFAGDFEIEAEFSTTNTNNQILLGDNHTTSMYFNIDIDSFNVFISGTQSTFLFGSQTPLDGKLHKIKYKLVGVSLELFLDGISLGSQTVVPYTGASNFIIGSSNSVNFYFNGIIANAKFTDKSGASDVVTTFKLDQATANIEYSQENVFGSEEVVNGDFATDSDWTKGPLWTINNGTAIYSAVSGSGNISQSNTTTTGKLYVVTVDVIQNDGTCSLRTNNGTAVIGDAITGTGLFSFVFLATGSQITFRAGFNTNPVIIDNVSVKEITNAVTYENIPQSASELYTLDGDTWTGSENVINGDFATDSDWSKGAGWSIANGTASHTGGASYLSQSVLQVDTPYKVNISVTSVSGGGFVQIYMGNSPASVLISAIGDYTYYFTSQSVVTLGFALRSIGDVSIDNVSVKEVIEVAS